MGFTRDFVRYDAVSAGAELFRVLVLDLLGRNTARGKIFNCRATTHMPSAVVVSPFTKGAAVGFTVVMNIYMCMMCVLYGATMRKEWQHTWVVYAACYVVFLVLVEMTMEAIMIGYVIPVQVLSDLRLLQSELHNRLVSAPVLQALLDHHNRSEGGLDKAGAAAAAVAAEVASRNTIVRTERGERLGAVTANANTSTDSDDDEEKGSKAFSAPDHLFVSTLVAREFPRLPESVFVVRVYLPCTSPCGFAVMFSMTPTTLTFSPHDSN